MNNRNTRENDVVDTRQIKNLEFGTGLLWIMDCGMCGMLMSILLISLLLKVVFSNVTEIIFDLGSIRQVFILSGINKLNI